MEDHPLRVGSLNLFWEELQEALTTLELLKEDQETLADHHQDRDEFSRQLNPMKFTDHRLQGFFCNGRFILQLRSSLPAECISGNRQINLGSPT